MWTWIVGAFVVLALANDARETAKLRREVNELRNRLDDLELR